MGSDVGNGGRDVGKGGTWGGDGTRAQGIERERSFFAEIVYGTQRMAMDLVSPSRERAILISESQGDREDDDEEVMAKKSSSRLTVPMPGTDTGQCRHLTVPCTGQV